MADPIGSNAHYNAAVDRQDRAQILAGPTSQARFEGVTLLEGFAYDAGTVLGRITASGKYSTYLAGGAGGLETAVGILMDTVDATAGPVTTAMATKGDFWNARVIGMDAPGLVDVGGRVVINAQGESILHLP